MVLATKTFKGCIMGMGNETRMKIQKGSDGKVYVKDQLKDDIGGLKEYKHVKDLGALLREVTRLAKPMFAKPKTAKKAKR